MSIIKVPANYVAAIMHFPALKDRRRVLTGIYFESTEEQAVMVGADGIILGAFRLPEPASDPVRVIVPREAFGKVKAKGGPVTVSVDDGSPHDSRTVVVSQGATLSVTASIPGNYADWRKNIHTDPSGEPADFNLYHSGRLANVARSFWGRNMEFRARIFPNGKKEALVGIGHDDFAGAIMPITYLGEVSNLPNLGWLHA